MKLTLDIDYDDFEEEEIIAISSSEKAYFLAFKINEHLKINLVKEENIPLEFQKKGKYEIFNYLHKEEHSTFRLIENKAEVTFHSPKNEIGGLFDTNSQNTTTLGYFIPELKQYDFIIKTDGLINSQSIEDVFVELKTLKQIQLINLIPLESLKSKQNLIFE